MQKYSFVLLILTLFISYKCKSSAGPSELDDIILSEIDGFTLHQQYTNSIVIDDYSTMHDVIEQEWYKIKEDESQVIVITYCEFKSSVEAYNGIAYTATRGNATPYIWGSFSGSVIKDGSWITSFGSPAVFFVRGNIGIRVFSPVLEKNDDKEILLYLVEILQKKVEKILSFGTKRFERGLKQSQLRPTTYQALTHPLINSEIFNDFSPISNWDSKWLTDTKNMKMGFRQEWQNSEGAIIGIDICQFRSKNDALEASKLMSSNTWRATRLFQLHDIDSLKYIFDTWDNSRSSIDKNVTIVAYQDNIAYHIYHYNPLGIDREFFISVVEKLTSQE